MKTVCSLISPVPAFMKRAVTNSGRAKVMSRSRHSSSECFGGSKTWSASSSLSWPVKSSIGEMSREDLGDALLEEPLEGLALDRDEIGQVEDLAKLGEGETFAGRETSQRHSLQWAQATRGPGLKLFSEGANGETRLAGF